MNTDAHSYADLGGRLRQARREAGLTQREAAQAIGLVPSALSQYESGKRRIDVMALDRLSHIYGLPVTALIAERPQWSDWEASLRRQAGNVSAASKIGIGRLIGNLRDLEELYRWAGSGRTDPPSSPFAPLSERASTPGDADLWAERARWHANLGSAPLPVLRSLMEAEGYLIFAVPLGREPGDLSGISLQHPEWGPVIAVNSDQPYDQWPTAMAHQLAHILFHYDRPVILCSADAQRQSERFAELFAGYFLVPYDALRNALPNDELSVKDPRQIVHLSRYFGVSYQTMRRRLEEERWLAASIDDSQASPAQLARALGYRPSSFEVSQDPYPPEERLPRRFIELAYRDVAERRMSLRRAAEMLGISDLELEERLDLLAVKADELTAVHA